MDRDFDYTELQPDGPRPCAVKECDHTEDDGELVKCAECRRHVCALCARPIGLEVYCVTCAVCSQCNKPTTTACGECGALVCEVHHTPSEHCEPCSLKVAA